MIISVVAVKVSNTQSIHLRVICCSFGAGHFSWVMVVRRQPNSSLWRGWDKHTHTQHYRHVHRRSEYRHLNTYKCARSVSPALWPCSYRVKLFSFNGLAICQGHIRTHTHAHTTTGTHTFQMMAICSATFHWDMCVHSNQESRHSDTQQPRQLLVSTGKCTLESFSSVLSMMQMSHCRKLGFPSIIDEVTQGKQSSTGIYCVRVKALIKSKLFYTHFGLSLHVAYNNITRHL